MDKERRLSLDLVRNDSVSDPKSLLAAVNYETDSPEALAYATYIKSERYAALAICLRTILDTMFEERQNRLPHGFLPALVTVDDAWQDLRLATLRTANDTMAAHSASPEYWRAQHYTALLGRLDSGKDISLQTQLLAGFDTAASTMLTVLRNLPRVAVEHGLPAKQIAATARQSVGLPWCLATISVNQLMASQEVLRDTEPKPSLWSDINVPLRTDFFKVHTYSNGSTGISFSGLMEQYLPAGYTPSAYYVPRLLAATALKDIAANSPVIGCPITLLPHYLHNLWNWYVDVIDQTNMWEST